jgi:hypothetical protein
MKAFGDKCMQGVGFESNLQEGLIDLSFQVERS